MKHPLRPVRSFDPIAPAALAALLLLVGGCTTVSRTTSQSIALLFHKAPPPTAEQVAAVPYPQLWLQAPDMSGTLVLAYEDDGRQAWFAGHEAVLYLQPNGLVSGLSSPRLKVQAQLRSSDPFARPQADTRTERTFDWMPGYRYGVVVEGRLQRIGPETITLPTGRTLALVRYEERLSGPGLKATNQYWVDEDHGFVWKSRQTLAPGYTIEITQLKPYRPAAVTR